jgi:glycosyltransferase involved in cell wall biosynthesis
LGFLASKSEGLPVALLEYGFHKMPVVVTDVGDVSSVITNRENSFFSQLQNPELFYESLVGLIDDDFENSLW